MGEYKNILFPTSLLAYLFLGISSFSYGFFEKMRFRVSKYLDAGSNTVLSAFGSFIALFISVIFLKEGLTIFKILGAFLVLIAIVLISEFKSSNVSKKGIFLGLISFTFLGIGWGVDKIGTAYFKPEVYNIFIWTIPVIIIYLPHTKYSEIKYEISNNKFSLSVMAFLNVIGYILQLKALSLTEAFKVIPVVQTSIILTVLAGVIFMNENHNIYRKIIAALLSFIGVLFLVNN